MTLKKMGEIFDFILKGMAIICGLIFMFIMLSVCIDVVMRYFFKRPMLWVIEISEYLLVYMTFIGAAWVLKQEGHIRMDIFTMMLKPRHQKVVGIISSLISAFVCLVICWFGTMETWDNLIRGVHTPSFLEVPKWPLLAIIPFGSLFLMFQFVRDSFSLLKNLNQNSNVRSES